MSLPSAEERAQTVSSAPAAGDDEEELPGSIRPTVSMIPAAYEGACRPTIPMSAPPPPRAAKAPPPRSSWSPRKVAGLALGLGVVMGLGAAGAGRLKGKLPGFGGSATQIPFVNLVGDNEPAVTPDLSPNARADAKLSRQGRSPVAGGLMTIPTSFFSEDGAYDLVIHFHGNGDLVEESFSVARVNAIVVIYNLGIGSGIYEDRFSSPMMLKDIEVRVKDKLAKRGLRNPVQRRLAFSSWSAGYGAIIRMLEQPAIAERVDSVLLLDGMHIGYMGKTQELHLAGLLPFTRFAERAVKGETLMVVTHSKIDPIDYVSTLKTTDALLDAVKVTRTEGGVTPAVPALTSIQGVVPKSKMRTLNPESEANAGGLHVRGYTGNEPEDHMAHLIQMATIALPDLVEHWQSPAPRDRSGGDTPKALASPPL
jgi:hypothetical protein